MTGEHPINPLQHPRLAEIRNGGKFWGYLDTEALQMRYVLAAHAVRNAANIIEVGGYRSNVITNFLTGHHASVTVYSLDQEFEPLERGELNGAPCRVRHVRDYFQNGNNDHDDIGLVAFGLEICGEMEPFFDLVRRSSVVVLGYSHDHQPSASIFDAVMEAVRPRVRCGVLLDFSCNEPLLREQLADNMNVPFWRRSLYVLEPGG